MTNVQLSLPSVVVIVAVVGAGAFAAGRSLPAASPPPATASPSEPAPLDNETANEGEDLPPGHPAVDPNDPGDMPPAATGAAPAEQPPVEWKVPARWQLVPNASKMRFATYRIPRAPGDTEDAELSIMQAGGSVDANATRWIGQFDAAGQKTAKRSARKVGPLEVTILEVRGTYSGGMGQEGSAKAGWALLGAIVATPEMPCFFKLVGPAKSVSAAQRDFDALIGSLAPR